MKQYDLGKAKINKLLMAFAIPCVISMLINSVYNIVDQIFIGKGVGTLGNAATNVIFPLVIFCTAIAQLIGNGTAAHLSLKLGEKREEEAKRSVGSSITILILFSLVVSLLAYLFLPKLIYLFGCTESVYQYALDYGRVILLGAPFMIVYTGLASIIRADGSPRYSMIVLVVGALINLVLDPIFIFVFHQGVQGGALATVIGQFVSFLLALFYLPKMKSFKLKRKDYKPNRSIGRVLSLGLSSFITQMTILALFVFMNNVMTKYGALTKYGADIPLSVYGVISKLNSFYVSAVLGISIGAQPILGFNYGAGNNRRVRETLKKVLIVNIIIGIVFNFIFFFFPQQLVQLFIHKSDANYSLFLEFAVLTCRSFLLLCFLNAVEMTTSIVIQSLGKVFKATAVSFIRQIILFIPLALVFASALGKGIYGILYAGPVADVLCFLFCIFLFGSEYRKISTDFGGQESATLPTIKSKEGAPHILITINREYGSGGRYVAELLAKRLGIPCYDKELIHLAGIESGLADEYILLNEEAKKYYGYQENNDDRIFLAEATVIKRLAKKSSCIVVGRCADYVLEDNKNLFKVFLYSSDENKKKRVVKYYGIKEKEATDVIRKVNRAREKHYRYYTGQDWKDLDHYDCSLDVDTLGVLKTAEILETMIRSK